MLQRPICCGMRSHVVVENTAAADFHDEKDEQTPGTGQSLQSEIASDDPLGMILDERSPVVRRGPSVPGPIWLEGPVFANRPR
jgi:hypothetical protein